MKSLIQGLQNNWVAIKNVCRTTVNKEHTENIPTEKFKMDLLISEHSPIRMLQVHWLWQHIPSWVSVHWSRHKFEKWISTQRSDRTGIDRTTQPQDAPVNFEAQANAQNLIDVMRKRLCYQASPETRQLALDLKFVLRDIEPELSDVLVPNCVYRCGCPEFKECGFWTAFTKNITTEELQDIRLRYKKYNAGIKYIEKN